MGYWLDSQRGISRPNPCIFATACAVRMGEAYDHNVL